MTAGRDGPRADDGWTGRTESRGCGDDNDDRAMAEMGSLMSWKSSVIGSAWEHLRSEDDE